MAGAPHPGGEGKVPSLRGLVARKKYKDVADLALALQNGETLGYEDLSSGGMARDPGEPRAAARVRRPRDRGVPAEPEVGLTADFEVIEDGKRREVVSFTAFGSAATRALTAPRPTRQLLNPHLAEGVRGSSNHGEVCVGQLLTDLRLAARLLAKSPGFTAMAVLSLALGVGANTTIFSLLNAFLLQPLPGREPARLATVYTSDYSGPRYSASSYPDYLDFRAGSRAFEGLAAYGIKPLLFTQGAESQRVLAQLVSGNFFDVLGLPAAYGRTILPAEETAGQHPVVVLSDAFWRSRFAADPARGRPHGRAQREALHGRRHRPGRLQRPRPRHRRRHVRPDRDGPSLSGDSLDVARQPRPAADRPPARGRARRGGPGRAGRRGAGGCTPSFPD